MSKLLIAEALTEAGEGVTAVALAKFKRAEAASQAEAFLYSKRWLLAVLRLRA